MHRGYIKLYRKLEDWEWYDDLRLVGFFIHLILSANHNQNNYHGHIIPRGSLVFGRKAAAKQFGIGEQVIRTMLTRLKSTSEITIKSTNKFSIIFIVNFEKYQDKITSKETNNLTFNQPATNQQLTTLKEVKKLRSKEINTYAIKEMNKKDDFDALGAFNSLLSVYPVKIGQSKARQMFFQWLVTKEMADRIHISIKKYKDHLSKNSWKTAMNFNSFLESWTDWENHIEPETSEQKDARIMARLKEPKKCHQK